MKVVYVASSRIEADIVAGKLEDGGIRSYISSDDTAALRPALQMSLGVKVLVEEDCFDDAIKILKGN